MSIFDKQIAPNRVWALLIGFGIALSPIHNQWLTELVIEDGEVGFFLPAFGTAIWLIATLCFVFVYDNWYKVNGKWRFDWRNIDLGNRQIYIPLLVVVVAIGLSGITADSWGGKVAPLLAGVSLFSLYLVARKLGKDVLLPLAIGSAIASLGVIIHGFIYRGEVTGGFLFGGNYDIVVGYVLLSGAFFIHRYQWLLAGLALVAMFFTGSPEAILPCVAVVAVMLWRKDWGKRAVIAITPTIIIALLWFGLGYGQELYTYTWQIVRGEETMVSPLTSEIETATEVIPETEGVAVAIPETETTVVPAVDAEAPILVGTVHYRLQVIGDAMTNLKPFGVGYILTDFSRVKNVHNVPLVLVQQLGWAGILAAGAWLWITVYCLVKTKWKYAWVLILALSVFDHYIFTQLAPLWWCLIGVSTTSEIKSDLIFREG